jgi:sodium-dependent dicarboxylate transporter 2/3/5
MLLPVALAVLERADRQLAVPLLLGVAYAASIGGIGTPIGTPPNLIFMQVYGDQFGQTPNFPEWMSWGLPVVIIMIPITAVWLTRGVRLSKTVKLPPVGQWTAAEKRVMSLFALTAVMWITRQAPFGGWSQWFGLPAANDASVALLAVIVMAIAPDGEGGRLLRWESARKIPWGVLLLFGGGIAIASAFMHSGLADHIASQLGVLATLPTWLMILLICLIVTFMTEMTSNTATTSLLMPLLAAASPMLVRMPPMPSGREQR